MSSSIGTSRTRRKSISPSNCCEKSPFPRWTRSTDFSSHRMELQRPSRRLGRTISVDTSTLFEVRFLESPRSSSFRLLLFWVRWLVMQGASFLSNTIARVLMNRASRDEIPEFIDHLPHCEAGICLTDPADSRHQFVVQLRERTGTMLHDAVQSLKNNGAEDSIDCVKMIIASVRVLELDYPCDHAHYATVKKSYEFALQVSRTTTNQKAFPRYAISLIRLEIAR